MDSDEAMEIPLNLDAYRLNFLHRFCYLKVLAPNIIILKQLWFASRFIGTAAIGFSEDLAVAASHFH
jgi:hypothetical protein